MNFNIKNASFTNTIIVVAIFTFYKSFPVKIQIHVPLILVVYFAHNIGLLIYQRRYWEEIFRKIILFVLTITIFITYYNAVFKFDYSFTKTALLIGGWAFPCLAYTGIISCKRKGDLNKYRQNLFFLAYCIFLAVFCTVIVIVK